MMKILKNKSIHPNIMIAAFNFISKAIGSNILSDTLIS